MRPFPFTPIQVICWHDRTCLWSLSLANNSYKWQPRSTVAFYEIILQQACCFSLDLPCPGCRLSLGLNEVSGVLWLLRPYRKSTSLPFFLLFDRKKFSSISQRDNVVREFMHVAVRVWVMEIKLFTTWGEQGAEINRHWDLSVHTVQPGWCYKYVVSRHSVVCCINKLWDSVLYVC